MAEQDTEHKTITASQRLQLIGLATIAGRLNAEQTRLVRAAAEITGEPDDGYGYFGLTTDLVAEANGTDPEAQVDELLRKLEVGVED